MTAAQALAAGASIEDLLWVAAKIGRKDLCVRFALACAQRTAHLNPDPRVQKALNATQAWLDGPNPKTADYLASASDYLVSASASAHAAALNTPAASPADYAARAAGQAANVAAYLAASSACAAASAAYLAASAYGAREPELKEQQKLFLEIFV